MKYTISLLVILCALFKSDSAIYHGIGQRVFGDKLLIKDVLSSPTSQRPRNHTIRFQHTINKPVSYIELFSERNVQADFLVSFDAHLLYGTVTAVNTTEFELTISIFGYENKEAPIRFKSLLEKSIDVSGIMTPEPEDDIDEYSNEIDDYFLPDENDLGLGTRQKGDKLIFTKVEKVFSEHPKRLSVIFYFVDKYYLTHASFATIGSAKPTAEFTQVTDHSIKAVLFQDNIKYLWVNMTLYGYEPENVPDSFEPLIIILKDPVNEPEVSAEKLIENCAQFKAFTSTASIGHSACLIILVLLFVTKICLNYIV